MNTAVAVRSRLPAPPGVQGALWRVLTEAIFPNAKSTDAIVLAMEYCRVRGLDILKKPVNIVPVWNSQLRREVETVWPAITEAQVTAARTHEWAGLDKPVYGPHKTKTFKGSRKEGNTWVDAEVTVTYPEWCDVTVYRMVMGARCAFTETVHWEEAYGRQSGGVLPNAMWTKRPFDQVAKVAKAASLRAAFPEEEGGTPTAEEMEGHDVTEAHVIDAAQAQASEATIPPGTAASGGGGDQSADPPPGWSPPTLSDHDPVTGEVLDDTTPEALGRYGDEDWRDWGQRFIARIRHAKDVTVIDEWMKLNEKMLEALLAEAPKLHANLISSVGRQRIVVASPQAPPPT